MSKLLSIIIPVYKVEKYLNKCLDSIILALKDYQADYEIIIVDDGSPDNCPAICDEYAKNYSQIHVFHNKNGGVSVARNFGINKASGKYVTFVDSDDYVNEKMRDLFPYIKENEDVDVFQAEFDCVNEHGNQLYEECCKKYGKLVKSNKKFSSLITNSPPALWVKIIKKDFLVANSLFLKEGRICAEDAELAVRIWLAAESFFFVPVKYYQYLAFREGSAISSYSMKHFKSAIECAKDNLKNIKAAEISKKDRVYFHRFICAHVCNAIFAMIGKMPTKDLALIIKELCKDKLLRYPTEKKSKLFLACARLIGFKNAIRLFALAKARRRERRKTKEIAAG